MAQGSIVFECGRLKLLDDFHVNHPMADPPLHRYLRQTVPAARAPRQGRFCVTRRDRLARCRSAVAGPPHDRPIMKIRNKEHATSKIGRVYKARVARRMLSQPALAGWKEKS